MDNGDYPRHAIVRLSPVPPLYASTLLNLHRVFTAGVGRYIYPLGLTLYIYPPRSYTYSSLNL